MPEKHPNTHPSTWGELDTKELLLRSIRVTDSQLLLVGIVSLFYFLVFESQVRFFPIPENGAPPTPDVALLLFIWLAGTILLLTVLSCWVIHRLQLVLDQKSPTVEKDFAGLMRQIYQPVIGIAAIGYFTWIMPGLSVLAECYLTFVLVYLVRHRCPLRSAFGEATQQMSEHLPKFLAIYSLFTGALLVLFIATNSVTGYPDPLVRILLSVASGYLGVLLPVTASIFYLNLCGGEREPILDESGD